MLLPPYFFPLLPICLILPCSTPLCQSNRCESKANWRQKRLELQPVNPYTPLLDRHDHSQHHRAAKRIRARTRLERNQLQTDSAPEPNKAKRIPASGGPFPADASLPIAPQNAV